MFGMGFTEILIIAVIAVLFLGPDKLPSAMIDIAKFFRQMKKTVGSVKDSLEEEMNVSEIKQEALAYKKELLDASEQVSKAVDVKSHVGGHLSDLSEDLLGDDLDDEPKEEKKKKKEPKKPKEEKVTFKKKEKTTKEDDIDV
jgi:sec-independent protein translocase protein TatB